MMNSPANPIHVAAWPMRDANQPRVTPELVIPQPGRVLGVIFKYEHADGHRSAALAQYEGGEWTSFTQPLPPSPPTPEFEEPMRAASEWVNEAGT